MKAPRRRPSALAVMAFLLCAPAAHAQGRSAGGLEVGFAVGWAGGPSFGTADASLRTRTGDDFQLFTTESKMGAAPRIEARAAYGLSSRYTVEGRFSYGRPEIRTAIVDDVEGAPDLEIAEQIDEYTFEGALLVLFGANAEGALRPFLSVGAGYLRQLHEGQTLVENGAVFHAGGGVRVPFFVRQQGVKTVGVRADARITFRHGGAALADGVTASPSIAGGVFVGF